MLFEAMSAHWLEPTSGPCVRLGCFWPIADGRVSAPKWQQRTLSEATAEAAPHPGLQVSCSLARDDEVLAVKRTAAYRDSVVLGYISMHTKFVLFAGAFAVASVAVAETPSPTATSSVTASAARKAHMVRFADGNRKDILDVEAGPNDSVTMVEVIDGDIGVRVPGSTISAGDKASQLNTSLTLKQAEGRP